MTADVPDFEQYRRHKQKQADEELKDLLHEYRRWLKSHTNLREKVRAKHLFAEKMEGSVEELEEQPWKNYFEEWFAFDYITIIGTRLFDMYVKETAKDMEPMKVQLSGLLMLAAWEPCYVIERRPSDLIVTTFLSEERKKLGFLPGMGKHDILSLSSSLILTRYVYCGAEERLFQPPIPIKIPGEEIGRLKLIMEEKKREKQGLRFLKENGLSWLRYV